MKSKEYIGILGYDIDYIIPGFEKSYPRGVFRCPAFNDRTSEEWFLQFVDEVEKAIGKKFLPIYRMGDGEFQFCVGCHYRYRANGEPLWLYTVRTLRSALGRLWRGLFRKRFVPGTAPGSGNWISGDYSKQEMKSLGSRYIEQLRRIGKYGYLALKFSYRKDFVFTQQYIVPMVRWLKIQDIPLHENNYVDFYFIYAMLTGPIRHRIYRGRRVLVVTSYNDAKREAIARGLKQEGVADAQFLPISRGRSMYDIIDLSEVKRPVDLVLVGGGIGASNILCQLEQLNTVAIDAGYIIECLADPDRKKQRTFCWPDDERNGDYRPI
jgi:hypothetical protein